MNAFIHVLLPTTEVKVIEESGSVQFCFDGPSPTGRIVIEITNPDQSTLEMARAQK